MNPFTADLVRESHEVTNQVLPLTGYNLFLTDSTLVRTVEREAAWARPQLSELGHLLGTPEAQGWGFDANENKPVLHTHDRMGNRRDEVVFHPAWHSLMQTSINHQVHSLPWVLEKPGAHVARAVLMMMTAQNEAGHTCPVSMTFSGIAALQAEPDLAREWKPKLLSANYDPGLRPLQEKSGGLLGMGMTEKQGGSDVRANTTRAERAGSSREYLITGHKWFCSAPMCDAFLVLAQAPKGLTCFLLPRWQPTGERNRFYLQRLKDKMGNRSNASSEVEFDHAWAQRVGEEGRGVHAIIEMVNHTRLDCAIAAAALMRQAVVQALHHAKHRAAFGKLLIDQPLMRNVLADLMIESEAATQFMLRLAAAFDARTSDPRQRSFARVATAIAKYWLCKKAPVHVGEALECLGGNGYIEESIMPRLYREAPLYSIWEGSGNVICLDILRALAKDAGAAESIMDELRQSANRIPAFDAFVSGLESGLVAAAAGAEPEVTARRLAEKLALALQASLLIRHSSPAVAEAFVASRLGGQSGRTFGTLPEIDFGAILNS
ncbi:MAG TPA: acyl-CoA dehydrogenase family protein [Candidatus Saccharimonadales bacterium]|jgi:putative acyl-CoA dehydrogenase|nr:acyl-CoA dehydrogenase family protein [Candidatus Saccharimonadales bacterium]